MIEEKASDLLGYLQELWLATPLITKETLENQQFNSMGVHGQISPTDSELIKFDYKIDKTPQGFQVEGFHVLVIDSSLIQHVKNELVDTAATEADLKSIDWNQSYQDIAKKHSGIEAIINDVLFLKLFDDYKPIADGMMFKYWLNTPMEHYVNLSAISSTPLPERAFFSLNGNFSDVDLKEAFALLNGRAVMKADVETGNIPTPYWLVYEQGKLIQLPAFELDKILRSLPHEKPLDENSLTEIMTRLISGELAQCDLLQNGKIVSGNLVADPRKSNVDFYDEQGKKVELDNQSTIKIENKMAPKTGTQRLHNPQKKIGTRLS